MKYQFRQKPLVPSITDTSAWINMKDDLTNFRSASPNSDKRSTNCEGTCCILRIVQFCFLLLLLYGFYNVATMIFYNGKIDTRTTPSPIPTNIPLIQRFDPNLLEDPPDDVLIDMKDFQIILEPPKNLCHSERILFLIVIHSSPEHFLQRQVIRETWGGVEELADSLNERITLIDSNIYNISHTRRSLNSIRENIKKSIWKTRLIFVLGEKKVPDENLISKNKILKEASDNSDLLIGSFEDIYENLRYKHIFGLRWASQNCDSVKFVLKADDDAFVDLPQLHQYLHRTFGNLDTPITGLIAGNVFPEGTITQREGKWAVSYNEYQWEQYPLYLGGLAYFMTPDVAHNLFKVAHVTTIPRVWVDDVWVTGILRQSLGLNPLFLNPRYSYEHEEMTSWLRGDHKRLPPPFTFAHLDSSRKDWSSSLRLLWEKTLLAFNMTSSAPFTGKRMLIDDFR